MTWLDLVCLLGFGVVAVGGYTQGFVRGILRLVALAGGGALGTLFMMRVQFGDDLRQIILWTAGAALLGILVVSLFIWSISRAIPAAIHNSIINRVLGIVPAFAVQIVVLTFALGLADRLALTTDLRLFLRGGLVTGPLIAVTDWLEQLFITIR